MISYVDIAFVIIAVLMTVINAKRGLVVSLIGMLRFLFIVPVSYFLVDYVTPYIPEKILADVPEELRAVVIFFVIFVVLIVVTGILMMVLKNLQNKKGMPLRYTNALLGGVFGFVKAVILIIVLSTVASFVVEFAPQDNQFVEMLNGSYVIDIFKDMNLEELNAFQI